MVNKSRLKILQKLSHFKTELDQRSLNARFLALVGCGLVILLFWYLLLWVPISMQKSRMQEQIQQQNKELVDVNEALRNLVSTNTKGNQASSIAKIQALKKQQAALLKGLQEYTDQFVPVNQRDEMLRQMVMGTPGVKIEALTSTSSKQINAIVGQAVARPVTQENGQLILEGNYFAILRYLQKIQRLQWQVFFDGLDYQVTTYPNAKVIFKFHTLTW